MFKVRYLEEKNKDKYDELINFEEEEHIYFAKSEYFGDKILSKRNGDKSLPLKSVTEFTKVFFNSYYDNDRARKTWNDLNCRLRMKNDKTYVYYGINSLEELEFKMSEGRRMGTKMHGHFEDMANLYEYRRDHPEDEAYMAYVDEHMKSYKEYKFFQKFINEFGITKGTRRFWRTEYKMFHPELHISGMIDGILYNEVLKGYEIIDYKRCQGGVRPYFLTKPFSEYSDNSKGKICPSLQKLLNRSIITYGIQLSLYRYMFQRMHPDKKVVGMYIISVDSKKLDKDGGLEIISIPLNRHDQNIYEMFQYRANEILEECGDSIPDELYQEIRAILPAKVIDDDETMEDLLDDDIPKKDYYEMIFEDL